MEYFLSKLPVILIAGLVIAALAAITVLCAEKNEAERDINEERCNGRCGSCSYNDMCKKPEKKIV